MVGGSSSWSTLGRTTTTAQRRLPSSFVLCRRSVPLPRVVRTSPLTVQRCCSKRAPVCEWTTTGAIILWLTINKLILSVVGHSQSSENKSILYRKTLTWWFYIKRSLLRLYLQYYGTCTCSIIVIVVVYRNLGAHRTENKTPRQMKVSIDSALRRSGRKDRLWRRRKRHWCRLNTHT